MIPGTQNRKSFLMGFMACALCVGCAGAAIQYKYYGLEVPDECYSKGVLQGKEGKDGWKDLPFAECRPDAATKGKCWVEISEEHFKKENELLNCRQSLKDCQAGNPPQ